MLKSLQQWHSIWHLLLLNVRCGQKYNLHLLLEMASLVCHIFLYPKATLDLILNLLLCLLILLLHSSLVPHAQKCNPVLLNIFGQLPFLPHQMHLYRYLLRRKFVSHFHLQRRENMLH